MFVISELSSWCSSWQCMQDVFLLLLEMNFGEAGCLLTSKSIKHSQCRCEDVVYGSKSTWLWFFSFHRRSIITIASRWSKAHCFCSSICFLDTILVWNRECACHLYLLAFFYRTHEWVWTMVCFEERRPLLQAQGTFMRSISQIMNLLTHVLEKADS